MDEIVKRIETKNNWLLWLLIGACSLVASGFYYYGNIRAEQVHIMKIIDTLDCVGAKDGTSK